MNVCEKKKKGYKKKQKRELPHNQNKTHIYMKKKKRERMVSYITFFLENRT